MGNLKEHLDKDALKKFQELKKEIKLINPDVCIRDKRKSSSCHFQGFTGIFKLFYQNKEDNEKFLEIIKRFKYKIVESGLDYKKNMTESVRSKHKYQYAIMFDIS